MGISAEKEVMKLQLQKELEDRKAVEAAKAEARRKLLEHQKQLDKERADLILMALKAEIFGGLVDAGVKKSNGNHY